ncbi:MAG: hypothetical protein SOY30_02330 [Eubacteriales bacterium]|nr:hypothetical protein [Eubacteriales bacterium]
MCDCRNRRPHRSRSLQPLAAVGIILLAAGLLLMFLCIPGWAWAALAGILLIAAGCALIHLSRG